MKFNRAFLALITAGIFAGSAGVASAATCNATQGSIPSTPATPANINGNSCGHNANFNGGTWCGGDAFSNTGTDAYQVSLGAGQNFTFTVASTGAGASPNGPFSPDIGLLATTCADNATCVTEVTNDTATATTGTISGYAGVTYFIMISDSSGAGNQCVPYTLSFTGSLPVKLEKFSVN